MIERVVLVGGGGREHAIGRAITRSDHDAEVYVIAGNRNPGLDALAAGYDVGEPTETAGVVEFATRVDATLAVVGPEAPLAAGVADALDAAGVYTFGPRSADARIETDKAFQREFMREHGIPGCPDFTVFGDADSAAAHVAEVDGDVAVKPTGLTGGKGVRVTGDQVTNAEAADYIHQSGHEKWVIEERLVGEEFTLQALVANGSVRTTPAVQDHKRAFEGDEGPNTGGMGSYSASTRTLPFMTEADYDRAVEILEATVAALPDYKGVLYGQFMLTAAGPTVVEFNARFGDPEAMNTLPVLETDFLDVLLAARAGRKLPDLRFSPAATVCKYLVPAGYPTDPEAGTHLTVDEARLGDALLFYASVEAREGGIYTTTSRSLAVVGIASSIDAAETIAEQGINAVAVEGVRARHDIGTSALVQQRIAHMNELRGG